MATFEGSSASETITGTQDADNIRGNGGNDTLNGLGGDDTIEAGSGSDVIDGGTGADLLLGGGGNDIYYIDNANDVVRDFVVAGNDGGFDMIYTSVSYTLGQTTGEYVERLSALDLRGVSSLTLIGNALNNEMWGDDGVSVLDGGAGADILHGEEGNDIYFVDSGGDITIEAVGGGYDTVFLTAAIGGYSLLHEVERVVATATAGAIALGGNVGANEIIGNDFANTLSGNTEFGALYDNFVDVLIGAGGDDIYRLGSGINGASPAALDVVIEFTDGGHDRVETNFSYALPDNVEDLYGFGTLTGNDLDNVIIGIGRGDGATDVIDGRGGADYMQGGDADDVYFADNPGDQVIEDVGRGKDTVFIGAFDYVLPDNVERGGALDQLAAIDFNLTGNSANNELWGNAGANWLDGKLGLDVLTGGAGADTFAFTTKVDGDNADKFLGFQVGVDEIALDDAVFLGLTAGALADNAFHIGDVATDANQRILYDPYAGYLFFDPDGSGSAPAQFFAAMHDGLPMTAADFVVI